MFSSGRSPSGSDFSGQSFTPGGSTDRAPTMEWLPTQLSSNSCAPSAITAPQPTTQPRSCAPASTRTPGNSTLRLTPAPDATKQFSPTTL